MGDGNGRTGGEGSRRGGGSEWRHGRGEGRGGPERKGVRAPGVARHDPGGSRSAMEERTRRGEAGKGEGEGGRRGGRGGRVRTKAGGESGPV